MTLNPLHPLRRRGALSPGRAVLAVLAGLGLALAGSAAPAASPSGAVPATPTSQILQDPPSAETPLGDLSRKDLRTLIATLEDPERRQRLLAELRALEELPKAQGATAPAETPQARPLGRLIEATGSAAKALWGGLRARIQGDYSDAVGPATIAATWNDPQRRWALGVAVAKMAAAGAVAWAIGSLAHWLLRARRRHLVALAERQRWWRLLPSAARAVLAAVPPLMFLAVALIAGNSLGLPTRAQAFFESVAAALAAGGLAQALLDALLGPQGRLASVSDRGAAWLRHWLYLAVWLAVAGFVASETLLALDYPPGLAELALKGAGGAIAAVLCLVLFQARRAGAARIRSYSPYTLEPASETGRDMRRTGPAAATPSSATAEKVATTAPESAATAQPADVTRHRMWAQLRGLVARIWHLLAIGYVVVAYTLWAFEIAGGLAQVTTGTALTLGILLATHLAVLGVLTGLRRKLRVGDKLARRVPTLPRRIDFYRPGVEVLVILGAYFAALAVILQAWGLALPPWLDGRAFGLVGEVVFILVLYTLLWEFVRGGIEWYLGKLDAQTGPGLRASRARTLLPFLRNASFIILATLAILTLLLTLGVNVAPLLAGAGVVGIAIGFGAQTLVRDIITGLFIMIENQVEIGDWVDLGSLDGQVEGMSIRTIQLRDMYGTVHVLPFSQVNQVSNFTRDYAYAFIEAGFAYQEDVDAIVAVMRAVADEMAQDPEVAAAMLAELEIHGLERFESSAIVIRARVKTVAGLQWWLRREFLSRLKKHCAEAGIEIPLPHTKLYFGQSKDGETPPARVAMVASGDDEAPTSAAAEGADKPGEESWSRAPGGD